MSKRLSVLIVGGGIGGLAAARALHLKGFKVLLLEASPSFSPTAGAGFGFSPNGQICLDHLGFSPKEQQAILHPLLEHVILGDDSKVVVASSALRVLQSRNGVSLSGCLRSDVVSLLQSSLPPLSVRFGCRVVGVSQDGDGVTVDLEGGGRETADLLVGADGINSRVCRDVFPEASGDEPIYSGENVFYGVIDKFPAAGSFKNERLGQRNLLLQMFEKGEFLAMGIGGEGNEKMVWAQTYRSAAPPRRGGVEWEKSPAEDLARFLHSGILKASHPAHELSAVTDPQRIMHFGLFFRRAKSRWHKGRVVLLGDACHATLPYVGQGANQAMEDAVVLAECLAESGPGEHEQAFERYYSRRFKRTKKVVDTARFLGLLMHTENWFVKMVRDAIFKLLFWGGGNSLFMKVATKRDY